MNTDKFVVGLAGMPGSGKSLVVEAARDMSYSVVVMGDVIREETLKRGLELNPVNVGRVMLSLREEGGNSVVAQKCIPRIEEQANQKVIVDGLRSLFEAEAFRAHFANFTLLAVHASPESRFNRLFNRRRSDDSAEWEGFHERDLRELSVGLGNTIAMAEHMIVNDNSIEQVRARVRQTLERIETKWNK